MENTSGKVASDRNSQLHLGDCNGLEDTPEHLLPTAEQTTMARIS